MQEFEKLGEFYLGKRIGGTAKQDLMLYESKHLTTHAVCVGMTGSGKTGLGITLLEEAAIDGIPSIIIDPKGDLGDLLLTFPHLSASEFLPWIDKAEAEKKGMSVKDYSEEVATKWKEGLEKSGQDASRIRKLKSSVSMTIYTPASKAGVPISILTSFTAPSKEFMQDESALQGRILSTTSALLGLLGINADPIKSREHILISTIIDQAWKKGQDLDIATLIHQIQNPLFDKIGVLSLDTFFPAKDRLALSISLNNLLASPAFQAWMEGEPLDIEQLLHTKEGKPKLSIIAIAHLSDAERMFFVTLLLNALLSWMRLQSGTSSLRAILYMDEIFGFFPPVSTPPSKLPMLTLLKQARAFGIGIVLATQNPVDLDYKGLSNCGTWFIGKLQTDRDKSRVLEGLQSVSNAEMDSKTCDKMLDKVASRIFLMRSIYESSPILFQTRWTLSYLKGPLTLAQIEELTEKHEMPTSTISSIPRENKTEVKPFAPQGVAEYFVNLVKKEKPHYTPKLLGIAKLHFVDTKHKIDTWQQLCFLFPLDKEGKEICFEDRELVQKNRLEIEPQPFSSFDPLPAFLMQTKNYKNFEKTLLNELYQSQTLTFYKASDLNLISTAGEKEGDFKFRIMHASREKRDEMIKKLKDKYAKKMSSLTEKVRRSKEKMMQKEEQASRQKTDTLISFGTTILDAVMGRKVTKKTISQTGTSMRRAGRIGRDNQDKTLAEQTYLANVQELEALQDQLEKEILQLTKDQNINLDTLIIRPRKSDLFIEKVALAWCPS